MSLSAAFKWFFKVLKEGEPAVAATAPPPPAFTASTEPAVQVLALFQKEGRLVDFLMEDVSGYSDAEVGAAVRDIHRGCRRVLLERMKPEAVLAESEGSAYAVPAGFDASSVAVTGNVTGQPPYRGTVRHRGWRVPAVNLPTVPAGADAAVVAPAEVEVP